jgi:trans-2,3-dihydro-3-hydroxyanthranilate isomerase
MSTPGTNRHFDYALLDVFSEQPLEGNMLAVFTDARGLSDAEMQALARETNLAETTFILPAESPQEELAEGVRVRIFTTQEELPFAGHPTLGTAAWMHLHHPGLRGAEAITLKLKGGPVTVRFRPAGDGEEGVFGTMQQADPIFGQVHAPEDISRITGIPIADLDTSLPIQTVSTGLPFCIIPVRSLEALARLQVQQMEAQSYLAQSDAKFFYAFTRASSASSADFQARMQFYNGEDPATGSASGCSISYMVLHGLVESEHETILEQGVQILRPSQIFVSACLTDGVVRRVFVGGRTISVARGSFSLPAHRTFPQPIVIKQQQ